MIKRNKNLFENTPWQTFSTTEGLFRAFNFGILKVIAAFFIAPIVGLVIVGIIGLFRLIGALVLTLRSGFEIFPNRTAVLGSILLGITTSYLVLAPLYVFSVSDMPIMPFAIAVVAGLVPGAIISKFKSRGKIGGLQIAGLAVTLVGLWSLLGFTLPNNLQNIPLALWLVVSVPLVYLVREIIVYKVGTAGVISPWVHHIWIGLSMMVFSVAGIVIFNVTLLTEGIELINLSNYLWLVVISSLFYLVTIFARQKSFRVQGGVFAKKKFLMASVLLVAALIVDTTFFGFVPSMTILGSLVLVIIGYSISDNLLFRGR